MRRERVGVRLFRGVRGGGYVLKNRLRYLFLEMLVFFIFFFEL